MRAFKRGLGKQFSLSVASGKDPSLIDVLDKPESPHSPKQESSPNTAPASPQLLHDIEALVPAGPPGVMSSPQLAATSPAREASCPSSPEFARIAPPSGGVDSMDLIRFAEPPSSPISPVALQARGTPGHTPHEWRLAPPSPRRFSPMPHSAGVGLPLETLGEVQHALAINPWMLALPELAPFQAFIQDLAAAGDAGTPERMLRAVRAEASAELEAERAHSDVPRPDADEASGSLDRRSNSDKSEDDMPARAGAVAAALTSLAAHPSDSDDASDAVNGGGPASCEVDARVYEKAAMLLPRRLAARAGPSSSYEDVLCAPAIHLVSVRIGRGLFAGGERPAKAAKIHIVMWAVDSRDRCVGGILSWPPREGVAAAVWNSARQLGVAVSDSGAHLRIELWASQTDTVLGTARVPLHSLPGRNVEVRLRRPAEDEASPRAGERDSWVQLRGLRFSSPMKTVFFIRHGESKWNEAQAKRDVLEMVSQVDHPLNEKGYRQACELRLAIQAAQNGVGGLSSSPSEAATLRALLAAQAIWSSPLTRAIQTALVGLQPLLEKNPPAVGRAGSGSEAGAAAEEAARPAGLQRLGSSESTASALSEASRLWAAAAGGAAAAAESAGRQIELKPNAREKKNMGGRDTQGLVVGADCARRALAKLAQVAPADELRGLAAGARLNCDEVDEAWWNTSPEGKDEVQVRMRELLHQIHYSEHDTIVIVGHSHFFRAMFQRFLHGDVARRSADLATRLCEDVLPNCSVACCQLDFSRGPRMITDVRLLVTSPSPSGGMKLVMQRQFEQFAGPVVHLVGVNNVPLCEAAGARVAVSMWLADSSGVHIGRHAVWPASTPTPASPADARAVAEAKRNRSRRAQSVLWRGRCMWNSAHQLGQSHWGADSILHIAVRSAKTSALLASAELPMRCVPPEGIELGALSAARHGGGKPGPASNDDPLRPCTVTLRCVPPDRGSTVKHLFLLHTAESSWSEAYRTMLRAAGLSDPRGAVAGGAQEAPVEQGLPQLKQRLGRMVDRGQEAYQRLRAVMARTDHPISRNGYEQARRLRSAIEASVAVGTAEPPLGGPDGAPDAQRAAILSVLHGTRAIWSSPATRAVQTAQLATLPLLPAGEAIELKANARQRRGLTNPNTSIGVASGDAIHARCVENLRGLAAAADEAALARVEARPLDTQEVSSVWWSDKAEPERDFQARLAELVAQVRHSPHESIILCAHDDIFHELLGRYTNPSARGRHAALLEQLAAGSVPPCALIWCCLDFGREHAQPITDIRNVGELLPQLPDAPLEPGLERVGTSPR